MKIKVQPIGQGSHPSEVIVSVDTANGSETLVVHQRSIENGRLDIGYPINSDDSNYLVELPRETVDGSWRVWVPQALVVE